MNPENIDEATNAGPPGLIEIAEPGESGSNLPDSGSALEAEDSGAPPEWLVESINESAGST